MSEIALGVVTLNRVDRLSELLYSAESSPISKVYVADNGHITDEKEKIYYNTKFDFELTVFDLEYDVGLGYGRNYIAERLNEEYLLVADDDHRLSGEIHNLRHILQNRPSLGGVGGTIIEPKEGRIWQSAKDLQIEAGILTRGSDLNKKKIKIVKNNPFVQFDFVPYPTLYRKECIEDYSWDPQFEIGRAHLDFYLHHKLNTKWSFGICPSVFFEHYPGGDSNYVEHRNDEEKYERSFNRFRNKWCYEEEGSEKSYWFHTDHTNLSVADRVKKEYYEDGVSGIIQGVNVVIKELLNSVHRK